MLSTVQLKKPTFEKLNMIPVVLELKYSQSDMARLLGKLAKAFPVCVLFSCGTSSAR